MLYIRIGTYFHIHDLSRFQKRKKRATQGTVTYCGQCRSQILLCYVESRLRKGYLFVSQACQINYPENILCAYPSTSFFVIRSTPTIIVLIILHLLLIVNTQFPKKCIINLLYCSTRQILQYYIHYLCT